MVLGIHTVDLIGGWQQHREGQYEARYISTRRGETRHNLLCHPMGAGSHFVRSLGAGAIEMDLLSQAADIADDYVKLLPDGLGRSSLGE